MKWWQRKGSPSRGFSYADHTGKAITGKAALERINELVIPPAWRYVRISPHAGGKLQAVGMDTTGRAQYLYHADFTKKQQKKKFAKIERFGERLPRLKMRLNEDIMLEGLPREKVLATVLRLINSLYFRVGTDANAKIYRTYGITTLMKKHLSIGKDGELCFEFVGKSHVKQRKILVDNGLAEIMSELIEVGPKRKLFHYIAEDGKPRPVKPADINRYIKDIVGEEFSSKDLRTWGASLFCAVKLSEAGPADNEKDLKANLVETVKLVAEELGNTPAVCRSSYIHPAVTDAYASGITIEKFLPNKKRKITRKIQKEREPEEAALLKLFEQSANGGGGK